MPSSCNEIIVEFSNSTQTKSAMKFPYFASGEVIKGFGRGSKQLGIPTANFPESVIDTLPEVYTNGVYYGFAQINNGPVYKMCMSIGNNPYYNNTKRTMETHIMHEFENDFYGSILKTVILGYIRPMANYKSLEDLIAAIKKDIADSHVALDLPENLAYKTNDYFSPINVKL